MNNQGIKTTTYWTMCVVVLTSEVVLAMRARGNIVLHSQPSSLLPVHSNDHRQLYHYFLTYWKQPNIDRFAKHTLCKGKREKFREILNRRLTRVDDSFVDDFLDTMCDGNSGAVLKLWARELFDYDGDGFITEHEKQAAFYWDTED